MLTCSDQKQFFQENGYLTGIHVCDDSEAARYRDCFDRFEKLEGKEKCAIGLLDRHFDQRFIWELASHPRVLEPVRAVLGPDVFLLATHFFCKYGPQEKFVAWHQDVSVPQKRHERWESGLPQSACRSRLQTTMSGCG